MALFSVKYLSCCAKEPLTTLIQTVCDVTAFSYLKITFKLLKSAFMFELVNVVSFPRKAYFNSFFTSFLLSFTGFTMGLTMLAMGISLASKKYGLRCSKMNW